MKTAYHIEAAWSDATVQLMLQLIDGSGGFSLDKNGFPPPSHGYMVALQGDEHEIPLALVRRDPTPVVEYYHNHQYILGLAGHYVGGWIRGSNLVFEISEWIPDRGEALALGQDRNQDEIYDLAAGHSIRIADDLDMQGRRPHTSSVPIQYEQITADGMTHFVHIVWETPTLLLAWITNRDGKHSDKQWLLSTDKIESRVPYEMDYHYETLKRTTAAAVSDRWVTVDNSNGTILHRPECPLVEKAKKERPDAVGLEEEGDIWTDAYNFHRACPRCKPLGEDWING